MPEAADVAYPSIRPCLVHYTHNSKLKVLTDLRKKTKRLGCIRTDLTKGGVWKKRENHKQTTAKMPWRLANTEMERVTLTFERVNCILLAEVCNLKRDRLHQLTKKGVTQMMHISFVFLSLISKAISRQHNSPYLYLISLSVTCVLHPFVVVVMTSCVSFSHTHCCLLRYNF